MILAAAAVSAAADTPVLLGIVLLAGGILAGGLNVAGAGAATTGVEALAYAAGGAVFAVTMLTPSLALTLPAFVALVDAMSTTAGTPTALLPSTASYAGDALSLSFPEWGTGLSAGRLGIADAVLAGVFLTYARRYGMRPVATPAALWLGAVAAILVQVNTGTAVPVVPFMAFAYFVVNVDRLPALARRIGPDV